MDGSETTTAVGGVIVSTAGDRFQAMRTFYVDVLDLSPRSDRDGFLNVDLDGVRLTVATHTDVSGVSDQPARIMINLIVDDIDRRHAAAVARGATSIRPPEPEHWGGRICTLADPDGNYVQLMTPDPR